MVKKKHTILLLFVLLLAGCTSAIEQTPGGGAVGSTPTSEAGIVSPTFVPTPTISPTGTQNMPDTLRAMAKARGILIGTAVNVDALEQQGAYAEVLGREFDVVTPENAMKFDALEPAPGVFQFQQADELVAFAKSHQMQVHGHNFVWYQALPSWVAHGSYSKDQLLSILHTYITTVMTHYKGQVLMWDVANEVLDAQGNFRHSIWYDTIGPEFLDMAYRWAREADPQVQLFYNDYGAETENAKSNAIYALIKGMLARGVPIDGIGFQMHVALNSAPTEQAFIDNMRRFAALGLKVQVSEMDVMIQGDSRPLQEKLLAQAQIYAQMLSACLSVSACESFTTWGFTDRYSWIPADTGHADAALPFDTNYQPKPAYNALIEALKS